MIKLYKKPTGRGKIYGLSKSQRAGYGMDVYPSENALVHMLAPNIKYSRYHSSEDMSYYQISDDEIENVRLMFYMEEVDIEDLDPSIALEGIEINTYVEYGDFSFGREKYPVMIRVDYYHNDETKSGFLYCNDDKINELQLVRNAFRIKGMDND
jgi:hypothetical protein